MNGTILEIENLTVSFGGFKALNQLNFSMKAGELRVIIGPNGAGKTTFLDVITGKVQPTVGRVFFEGHNLKRIPKYKIARLGIGRKFQTPRVFLNLTVRENLDLACNGNKNIFSTLFHRASTTEGRNVVSLLGTIGLQVTVLHQGSVLYEGTMDEVQRDPRVIEVYLGKQEENH
jgi:urea transport system ATP-binding protein